MTMKSNLQAKQRPSNPARDPAEITISPQTATVKHRAAVDQETREPAAWRSWSSLPPVESLHFLPGVYFFLDMRYNERTIIRRAVVESLTTKH